MNSSVVAHVTIKDPLMWVTPDEIPGFVWPFMGSILHLAAFEETTDLHTDLVKRSARG